MQGRSLALFQYVTLYALLLSGYGGLSIIVVAQSGNACLNQRCGDIQVSYPFKLTNATACPSFSPDFELECDSRSGYLFLKKAILNRTEGSSLRVINLSHNSLVLDVSDVTTRMYINASSGRCDGELRSLVLPGFPAPYVFSDENRLGGFGCAYVVLVTGNPAFTNSTFPYESLTVASDVNVGACDVGCPLRDNKPECGNRSCCVFRWPAGSFPRVTVYQSQQSYISTVTYDQEICSSSYGAIFHPDYSDFDNEAYGIKLMWALPSNQTTTLAIMRSPEYACSNHSSISLVTDIPGYLCSCLPGYAGDGYARGSQCTDIDECQSNTLNDCIEGRTDCHNFEGGYTCRCSTLFYGGDGRKQGSGCYFSHTVKRALIAVACVLGLALILGSYFALYAFWRKKLKRRYFVENGGMQLQQLLLMGSRGEQPRRLFNEQELKTATNNFSSGMKLGAGGFGTVFKGVLADGRVIAVKRSNSDVNPVQLFNEIEIMVHLNHRNIVGFLGCCVETQEPLLVYEYVSNGNVLENLREGNPDCMDWEQRLKVGMQTAEALAYLHGIAVPPILHRDVKSSNVLLDSNFDAKVADFGVSRLVPEGASHVSTAVQGTIGYLDPEYFRTLQLTEKSDVYSLGVMLVELITGLKPVDNHSREAQFANLALLFVHHMQDRSIIDDIIDARIAPLDRPSVVDVSSLAIRCLSLEGSQRPLMSEVAFELRGFMNAWRNSRKKVSPHFRRHSPVDHHRYGAVVATDSDIGIRTNCSSENINSATVDYAMLDCSMPR